MRHTFFLICLFCCSVLILSSSCKEEDLTPAYIQIEYADVNNRIDISTFNEDHGTNYDSEALNAFTQHNFTHVNVYVDGKNLGCWELPCKVPVLDITDGDSSKVIILPCFRKTGMANTIQGYPFLNILRQTLLLERGKTYDISQTPPTYYYQPAVKVPYLETFANSSGLTPNDTANNKLTFEPTDYDGRKVGTLTLNDANGLSFDISTGGITLPVSGYYVYLEVTYKIENSMEIGMKISTATYSHYVHQLGGIYDSDGQWKTILFDLTSVIQGYDAAGVGITSATLVFTGIGDSGTDTHFYIDNIKILYLLAS